MLKLAILVPPIAFLMNLFISEYSMKRKQINIDGKPPINKFAFFSAKYLVILVWAAMCLQAFGIGYSTHINSDPIRGISILLWFLGFTGLFIGKSILGKNFRLGTPMESTGFNINGLYRISRNPMYVSLSLTLIASYLYTLNPIVLHLGAFIIIVHHYIILAEERWLRRSIGKVYESYFQKVRRYI